MSEYNDSKPRRKRIVIFFLLLALSLTALLPILEKVMHPTLYIKSDTPVLKVSDPYIHQGEVDESVYSLCRGTAVVLEKKGENASTVTWQNHTLTVSNEHLAGSLEEVVDYDTVWPRMRMNLQLEKEGLLSDVCVNQGEALRVIRTDVSDLDAQSGEIGWYLVEKDGSQYYIFGKQCEVNPDHIHDGESGHSLSADLDGANYEGYSSQSWLYDTDMKGWAQPDFSDNPRGTTRTGIHITLENLIKNKDLLTDLKASSSLNTLVVALQGPEGQIWFENETNEHFFNDTTEVNSKAYITKDELKTLFSDLKNQGFYIVARLQSFKNSYLAADNPALAITHQDGTMAVFDTSYWLSPYSRTVWNYNASIAKECASLGVNEVQFDFCRFPEGTASNESLSVLDMKNQYSESKTQAIQGFLYYMRSVLEPLHVYTGADVFAGPVSENNDYNIGQYYPAMAAAVNVVSPMAYLEQMQNLPENYGIEVFTSAREVMNKMAENASGQLAGHENMADVRMWIQGYGLMSAQTLRNQMDGLLDANMDSCMIWTDEGDMDTLYPLEAAFISET